MSLLDAGIHSDHPSVIIDSDSMFNEDMFGYSSLRGRTSSRARSGERDRDADRDRDRDRESIFRIRDRRWPESSLREDVGLGRLDKDRAEGLLGDNKKAQGPTQSPLNFGEDLQFWVEKVGSGIMREAFYFP